MNIYHYIFLFLALINIGELVLFTGGVMLGAAAIVMCSLVALLFSFSSVLVTEEGSLLGAGLVPDGQTEKLYKAQLVKAIRKRERTLVLMNTTAGLGFVNFVVSVFVFFIMSLLPIPTFDANHMLTFYAVLSAWGACFIFAIMVSSVVFGEKGFHIYFGEADSYIDQSLKDKDSNVL